MKFSWTHENEILQGRLAMTFGWTHENEILQGRLAMVGFVAMVGAYLLTGQIIPNIW